MVYNTIMNMVHDTTDHRSDPRFAVGMKIYHSVMDLYLSIGRRSRDKEKTVAYEAWRDGIITQEERDAMAFFIDMAD